MVNRIRNRKKSVIIFISIAVALVGLVFLISAIVVSCNRDRRDELVFYIYVGPEKITYPGFRSKAQADEMVESGELKLLCELQNSDLLQTYTLAYGEEENQYLYIKYGVKGEDRLLDFNTYDSGMYVDIRQQENGGMIRLRSERTDISEKEQYHIFCRVATDHEIYQKFGASCIIKVN